MGTTPKAVPVIERDGTVDGVDMGALRRFVASIPTLRSTLTAPVPTQRELALRSEIRRTISELSGVLRAAAEEEPDRLRATIYRAASAAAADLARARAFPGRASH